MSYLISRTSLCQSIFSEFSEWMENKIVVNEETQFRHSAEKATCNSMISFEKSLSLGRFSLDFVEWIIIIIHSHSFIILIRDDSMHWKWDGIRDREHWASEEWCEKREESNGDVIDVILFHIIFVCNCQFIHETECRPCSFIVALSNSKLSDRRWLTTKLHFIQFFLHRILHMVSLQIINFWCLWLWAPFSLAA